MNSQQRLIPSPGPWIAEGPPSNIHIVQADAPHMRVCFLTSNGPTVANAAVLAASWDMLAILKEIVSPDNEALVWFVSTDAHAVALKERVMATIAKAEGVTE